MDGRASVPDAAQRKPRILLLGPLPAARPNNAVPIGGGRMRFAETIRQLERRAFDLDIVNTTRPRQNLPAGRVLLHTLRAGARTAWAILRRGRRSDLVFLNMSVYAALPAASVIWLLCRLLRRPLVIWFFGEYLAAAYQQCGPARRWLMNRTYLRADLVCVEVAREFQYFSGRSNFRQFPNTRDLPPPAERPRRSQVRQLLFIGQLRMEKGLPEMLAATRNLPADCQLRVFGPRMSNTDFALFNGHPRASYGGPLAPEDVPRVIANHDLLLFPSYWKGESYPGVITEALQCGVPVVATAVGGLPDMVQHETNGLLIEPRSAPQLHAAVVRLINDPALYQQLCQGARASGEPFRSGPHYDRLAAELRRIAGAPAQSQQAPAVMPHPTHPSPNDEA